MIRRYRLGWALVMFGSIMSLLPAANARADEGTPTVLPRPDFKFQGKVGKTYLDSDPPEFPQPVQAPKGAPNVVLILLDDTGFGQYGAFGGGVPSPTLDKLAGEGLRFNRFHTTALCSPTRAALITGQPVDVHPQIMLPGRARCMRPEGNSTRREGVGLWRGYRGATRHVRRSWIRHGVGRCRRA